MKIMPTSKGLVNLGKTLRKETTDSLQPIEWYVYLVILIHILLNKVEVPHLAFWFLQGAKLFIKHLLRICCVPGTVLGSKDRKSSKMEFLNQFPVVGNTDMRTTTESLQRCSLLWQLLVILTFLTSEDHWWFSPFIPVVGNLCLLLYWPVLLEV